MALARGASTNVDVRRLSVAPFFTLVLLCLNVVPFARAACPSSGLTHPVKSLVPAYWGVTTSNACATTLTGYWASLAACGANCTAVINPVSGPGRTTCEAQTLAATYSPCITKLRASGVKVLGYIATGQGSKLVGNVQGEYQTYETLYPAMDGIFFDEGTSWYAVGSCGGANGDKSYYQQVAALVNGTKVLNPGGRFEPSMTDIFDIVVGFEQTGANWVADANYHGMCPIPSFTTAHTDDIFCTGAYPGAKPYVPNSYQSDTNTCSPCGAKIAALVHQSTDTNYVSVVNQCAAAGYAYCYVTNDGADGNPWDSLPSYFSCYAT